MQTEAAMPFPRITRDTAVMGGRPCIRGLRVTVGMILGNLGDGVATDELLAAYPYLDRENVLEVICYGASNEYAEHRCFDVS